MKRRYFLFRGFTAAASFAFIGEPFIYAKSIWTTKPSLNGFSYTKFKHPDMIYRPFVRWWWNGNKIEKDELIRELHLLKKAGIGGVEINPVKFPERTDDMGKKSLRWLSDEWIEMLKITCKEAKALGITCDLIVGSGWPFGAEYLAENERSQIVTIGVKKLKGPLEYEISSYDIVKEADPAVNHPYPGRTMKLLTLKLVPDPLSNRNEVIDLSNRTNDCNSLIKVSVPKGKHALYGLVQINSFTEVINGVPGANGPVLDHFSKKAVKRYLYHMSDTIQNKIGDLSNYIRSLFTDSLELEGANWTTDIIEEFIKRRGYDISPYFAFTLFKTAGLGHVWDYDYGVKMSPEFENMIQRMRYDFELTKAELLKERFNDTFTNWCKALGVKSRAQSYGKGMFPLESNFKYDIPEGESWTMTWIKHRLGEEMSNDDYRKGRAYTMINKYVSSAAHLKGKRLISCEEMTNTYTVFNATLENLKIGSDQSMMSGITHSVFHGFNYSPPRAGFPGWIRYGSYYSENNNWWPYFRYFNDYKARIFFILQNATMFADIAILPPVADTWARYGMQMEPFPAIMHPPYMTLVWEAINKNGNSCDYISESVIQGSETKKGIMHYNSRKYHSLFLIKTESIKPETARKLYEFITQGGRVFCIETYPYKSLGWKNHIEKDTQITKWVNKMKKHKDRFILLEKPTDNNFINWYRNVQKKYTIETSLKIEHPNPFVMQNRYQTNDGTEILLFTNAHKHNSHTTKVTFSKDITFKKYGWILDPETGERFRFDTLYDNSILMDLAPADLKILVFNKEKNGKKWTPLPTSGNNSIKISNGWKAEFRHSRNGYIKEIQINKLKDLKNMPDFAHFTGSIIYRNTVDLKNLKSTLNLGKVYGVSRLKINGKDCGVKWYGRRIYSVGDYLEKGRNEIEVKVVTTMGNYMKTLTENKIAQYWTNKKNKNQPIQSMGMIGPVTLY